jgi:hypothetical protein
MTSGCASRLGRLIWNGVLLLMEVGLEQITYRYNIFMKNVPFETGLVIYLPLPFY